VTNAHVKNICVWDSCSGSTCCLLAAVTRSLTWRTHSCIVRLVPADIRIS